MSEVAFVLRGKSNSGKSQTIKQVYENLLQEGAVHELPIELIGWKIDFYAVLILRGVRIGILSRSDEAGQVGFYLSILIKMHCAVIVCATRTTGGTVTTVNRLCSGYRLKPIEQVRYAPSFQMAGNAAMAKCITARVSDATNA